MYMDVFLSTQMKGDGFKTPQFIANHTICSPQKYHSSLYEAKDTKSGA